MIITRRKICVRNIIFAHNTKYVRTKKYKIAIELKSIAPIGDTKKEGKESITLFYVFLANTLQEKNLFDN